MPSFHNFSNFVVSDDFVIVGEKHRSEYSKNLFERVIDYYRENICGIAVEYPTEPFSICMNSGMDYCVDIAITKKMPLYYIDNTLVWMFTKMPDIKLYNSTEFLETINMFSEPVCESGEISEKCIMDGRRNVLDAYGHHSYNAIFTKRERLFVKRLNWIQGKRQFGNDEKILVGLGAFHVPAVEQLRHIYSDSEPPQKMKNIESVNNFETQLY